MNWLRKRAGVLVEGIKPRATTFPIGNSFVIMWCYLIFFQYSWNTNFSCYSSDHIREMLEKAGFTARIGTEHLFVSVHDAVIHAVGIHSEVRTVGCFSITLCCSRNYSPQEGLLVWAQTHSPLPPPETQERTGEHRRTDPSEKSTLGSCFPFGFQ